jgi:hypothetical protein
MAEGTEADLIVQLGMTMTKMNRQLAQAEARFNRTATKIERDFNRTNQRAIDTTATAVTKMQGALSKLGAVAGTGLGVVIGQGLMQISANAGKAIKALADLADQADRVGASVEEFQALQFGFQLAGVENADFVKAMETFTQRLGEAAEGTGELEDRLRAAGIRIRDAQGEIRPVTELLREYATAIQGAGGETTQMAMLNDAFGRSGRDLALAMRDGAAGIDEMVSSARDAGLVVEEEIVRRAADLDDRLDIVTQKAKVFMQTLAVYGGESAMGLALMVEDIRNIGAEVTNLQAILEQNGAAAQILGVEIVDALTAAGDATDEQAVAAQQLIGIYTALSGQATMFAADMDLAAQRADAMGRTAAADAFRSIADALRAADEAFISGEMSAEDFNQRLTDMVALAGQVLAPLQSIEGANFDSAAASVARFAMALFDAAVQAATLRENLPTYTPTMPTGGPGTFPVNDNTGNFNGASPNAPSTSLRPATRPGDIDFGYTPATGGGSPAGGGSTTPTEPEYWDELIASVREAEQVWEDYNETIKSGTDAATDFFMSILDGSKSAKEAVADLLMQMAKVQMMRGMTTLAGTGGTAGAIFGALGDALSFDGGGYTGSGSRSGGVDGKGGFPAILHPNETVIDHTKSGSGGSGMIEIVVSSDTGSIVQIARNTTGLMIRQARAGIVGDAVAASGKAMRATKSFGNTR